MTDQALHALFAIDAVLVLAIAVDIILDWLP